MRLAFSDERVLAVVAHPDDAELLCAGTLARARADGAPIGVHALSRGEKGQPAEPIENLGDVREGELQEAVALLEADCYPGRTGDGEVADTTEQRFDLIEVYRRFRPTLILAPAPEDYHPDHRAGAALAEAASWFAASFGHVTESPPLEAPPALWRMDTVNMLGFAPGFFVDIGRSVELKRRMLRCHRSQLERGTESGFSPLEPLMVRQAEARGAQADVDAAEAFRAEITWKRAKAW